MQILFNELSLEGQFCNTDSFINDGLLPFVAILKEMEGFSTLLLKNKDAWNRKITPEINLYSFVFSQSSRRIDELRRLKVAIVNLTKEPFWDDEIMQSPEDNYSFNGIDIWGSSIAEACERDNTVISFSQSSSSENPLLVMKNGAEISILNLLRKGELTEYLWSHRRISFEQYLKSKFSSGKLDFSQVDPKMGFDCVNDKDQNSFISSFDLFELSSWDQISLSEGFDYKAFHGSLGTKYSKIQTYKFRVSEKMRCHGYRKDDRFIVLGFETDHSLSDHG